MRAPVNCLTTRKPGLPRALRQRGQALLLALLVLGVAGGAALFSYYRPATLTLENDQKTADALARAKAALIGYALRGSDGATNPQRPGEFPCPDTDNDGFDDGTCVAGRLGRIPWKTLGIPEPKDSAGETLWYAIAGPFRVSNVNSSPINSDTRGNITVFAADGTTQLTPQAVAVIFAPGQALGGQNRDPNTTVECTTSPSSPVAQNRCAANYLETSAGRNNATTNGPFINGQRSPTYNDRVLYITTPDFIPAVEMRVGIELKNALSSSQRYPWAANFSINTATTPCSKGDGTNVSCPSYINLSMDRFKRGRFPSNAALTGLPSWFTYNNWHNVIYYGVAELAANTDTASVPNCTSLATCTLSVDGTPGVAALFFTPGTPLNVNWRLSGVPDNNLGHYLEDASNNDNADDLYVTPARTTATPLDRDRITVFRGSVPNCNQTAAALVTLAVSLNGCGEPPKLDPRCSALVANLAMCSCFSSAYQMITPPCQNNLNPKQCPSAMATLTACNS